MTNEKKLLSLIGLAKKAGKIITGEDGCETAIRSGQATLVLVATDASNNTKKKFTNKTTFYKVPLYSIFTKDEMSEAIGAQNRATIVVADAGFTKSMLSLISHLEHLE